MARILVVDDERTIRTAFAAFLELDGHVAVPAATPFEALEKLKTDDFDVVISDIIMPGLSGIELLERLRAVSEDIQIIMITGQPTVESAAEAVRFGAFDYLSKPVEGQTIVDVVNRAVKVRRPILENRRLTQENQNHRLHLEGLVEERTAELHLTNQQLETEIAERERMQETLQSTVDTLTRSMHGSIRAMALIVDKRDPFTAGHQHRVAHLAQAIATRLNLNSNDQEAVYLAASVHDIGKISVPAGILSKPGKLNEAEYAIVQDHPTSGAEILSTIDFPWPIAEIVHQHHERLDGSGYPRGLTGDAICLEARILAVADVVEAMASHRPYRPALGVDAALDELNKGRISLYDAKVVDACILEFNEGTFSFDS